MTVERLITMLAAYPPDMEVRAFTVVGKESRSVEISPQEGGGGYKFISVIGTVKGTTRRST